MTEACDDCGQSTPHEATIEIRNESTNGETTQFSREPYRITECVECGATTSQRMTNA